MNMSNYNLFITVFLLWLTQRLQDTYESYFAYILILTVGIFHGSNDIALIRFLNKGSSNHITRYLLFYVLLVLITCFVFIKLPLSALLIFIAFSCYHFGEQHFNSQLESSTRVYVKSFGLAILLFLAILIAFLNCPNISCSPST